MQVNPLRAKASKPHKPSWNTVFLWLPSQGISKAEIVGVSDEDLANCYRVLDKPKTLEVHVTKP